MGSIRKQTIISSLLVYLGFAIGALDVFLYSSKSSPFTPEQFGLTRIFFDFGQNMMTFGALGMVPVIYKFYPYYKDNLPERKIDLMSLAAIGSFAGLLLVIFLGWYFEPKFVANYSAKSKLVVDYYYWMMPFAIGMLFFTIFESFSWAINKSIFSKFLKETFFRILTTILILLVYAGWISFRVFILLFAFQFLTLFAILLIYLLRSGRLHFPLPFSRVTRKFWKKMVGMQTLYYGGTCIISVAATVDVFIIAGFQDLKAVGIFVFAKYVANLLEVPQRSIEAVSAGVLSRAWKDKNYTEIHRIYSRSCINLLLMAIFIFGNIWLNISSGMSLLHIQSDYTDGLSVIFVLGMVRIIDAGTGLNTLVINTSTFWRFDFISGIILFALRLPLTYFLIKNYGILGSAFAELAAYSIFNFIRFEFLRRKFNMQPFSMKTIWSLLLALIAYGITYFAFKGYTGFIAVVLRGVLFSSLMIAGVYYAKLTPDALQLVDVVRKRVKKIRN